MAGKTTWTLEREKEILRRMVLGESLNKICKDPEMPCLATWFSWLQKIDGMVARYNIAREQQAENYADQLVEISDNATNDWMEQHDPDNPGYKANGEHINRSRLRIDTRKWIASKLKPKRYGDKMQLSNDPENPFKVFLQQVDGTSEGLHNDNNDS